MTVLTCEKCQTQFKVPAEKIGSGRKVRCTSCGHIWFQEGVGKDKIEQSEQSASESGATFNEALSDYETAETVPDSIKPVASDSATDSALWAEDEETRKAASFTGVVVFVSLVLATLFFMLAAQNTMLRLWPQSAALYNMMGITPEMPWQGLRFSDGRAAIRMADTGENILYVEAEILNITDTAKMIPPVNVALIEPETGAVLQVWQPSLENIEILPGKAYIMRLGFTDIIEERASVRIYFTQRD